MVLGNDWTNVATQSVARTTSDNYNYTVTYSLQAQLDSQDSASNSSTCNVRAVLTLSGSITQLTTSGYDATCTGYQSINNQSANFSKGDHNIFSGKQIVVSHDSDTGEGHLQLSGYILIPQSSTDIRIPATGTLTGGIDLPTINNSYTVNYHENPNDLTEITRTQTKERGSSLFLLEAPVRTGYSFLGWADNSSGAGELYRANSEYTEDKDLELYVQWVEQVTIDKDASAITENNSNISSSVDRNKNTFQQSIKTFTIGITEEPSYIDDIIIKTYNGSNELNLTWTRDGKEWASSPTDIELISNQYRFDLLYNGVSILATQYETDFYGQYYLAPTIEELTFDSNGTFTTGTIRASGTAESNVFGVLGTPTVSININNISNDNIVSNNTEWAHPNWVKTFVINNLNITNIYVATISVTDRFGQTSSKEIIIKPATSTMWMGRNTIRVRDNLQVNEIVRIGDDHNNSKNYTDLDYTLKTIFNLVYPVGSIYLSATADEKSKLPWANFNFNVDEYDWERIDEGNYIMAAGETYLSNTTGGYIPSVCGDEFQKTISEHQGYEWCGLTRCVSQATEGIEFKNRVLVSNEGANNNPTLIADYRPSYYAVYVWKRIK